MKIAFFELEGWEENLIRAALPGHELVLSQEKIDPLTLPAANDFDAVSVFVNSEITPEVLAALPSLKFIATRSTGFDHVDAAACKAKNVVVSYVPGYGDNTVAEFAFGLILNLTRRIYHAIDQIKEADSFDLHGLRGMDIKGKTIGIIGTGRIGREMIRIAKGFGMNVLAHDPFPNAQAAQEMGFEYLKLEELLGRSDVISLHTPYNKDTHHLINKTNIALIKKGAYLVNTARGPIVETEALVAALKDGTLAGAGLDVLEEEGETKDEMKFLGAGSLQVQELRTMLQNHMLMKMPNVLITPHNAFNTQEAMERILGTTLENVQGFVAGTPKNLIPGT